MAKETKDTGVNINTAQKGMYKDSHPMYQPKGTYRYAQNAVSETSGVLVNEEGNNSPTSLTKGYTPIGKCSISDNETIIFSVSQDGKTSEIGLLTNIDKYSVLVNDTFSVNKLNFRIDKPIQATYRLRRGCEQTIYFTDGYNKPRYFNLAKPQDFKTDGLWNSLKFTIQKTYKSIPNFDILKVLETGGVLPSGSYNIAVQYVDERLNPTEWITTSKPIRIYNDNATDFNEVNGSINSEAEFLNFPHSAKAIEVTITNLDNDFPYYRLAFIETNSGNGLVSRVKVSDYIGIKQSTYTYTGLNGVSVINKEEIALFDSIIQTADSIEQLDNRLILANTTGKNVDFCKLQKYASRINADCVTYSHKALDINNKANTKNPVQEIVGFMAGEIYSFGIVYIFKDQTLSPVFHIPGKNPKHPYKVYTSSANTFPMDIDNKVEDVLYQENNNCTDVSYWGLDGEGETLKGKNVRHHRFPLRNRINKPHIQSVGSYTNNIESVAKIIIRSNNDFIFVTPSEEEQNKTYIIRVRYLNTLSGQYDYFDFEVTASMFMYGDTGDGGASYIVDAFMTLGSSKEITGITGNHIGNISYTYKVKGDSTFNPLTANSISWYPFYAFNHHIHSYTRQKKRREYMANTLGIRFSNIQIPDLQDDDPDNEVIGYYIVRNERKEEDKTILDNAVLTQTLKNNKYTSTGLLYPNAPTYNPIVDYKDDISKIDLSVYGMIHPEHKFNNRQYRNFDELIYQGFFNKIDEKSGKFTIRDVTGGSTSLDYKEDPNQEHDDDWSLNVVTRDNILGFVREPVRKTSVKDKVKNVFYLDALESKSIRDAKEEVYNIACDNKIGIIEFNEFPKNKDVTKSMIYSTKEKLPYVSLKRNIASPYSNFRILPYYKCDNNPVYFDKTSKTHSSTITYGGDSYISPLRYVNSVFYANSLKPPADKKRGFWKKVVGATLVVIGVILAIPSGGGSLALVMLGAGILIGGSGLLILNSGIKADRLQKVYTEEYEKGLRKTTLDSWVSSFYNPADSQPPPIGYNWVANECKGNGNGWAKAVDRPSIEWIGDCLSDIWIESAVNMSLRNKTTDIEAPCYLHNNGVVENGQDKSIHSTKSGNTCLVEIPDKEKYEKYEKHGEFEYLMRPPVSSLEYHMLKKLTKYDEAKNGNRSYLGIALGEYYKVNDDYHKMNYDKWYYHLPIEYDCCTDCRERFPHRVHYSEQSFQEELSDNYKVFLPNNYKDIDGETGVITNIFSFKNNLFIHTEEALWEVPRSHQERVTDQIVSFIGTGGLFEVPARKIMDDSVGASAGSVHKWATLKTSQGVFFVSEKQRKVYLFTGQLQPISDIGMNKWFFDNVEISYDKEYLKQKGRSFPYKNNPQNLIGTGFISTYDYENERFILTKKDYSYYHTSKDYLVTGNDIIEHNNIPVIIEEKKQGGWKYKGVKNGELEFEKYIEVNVGQKYNDDEITEEDVSEPLYVYVKLPYIMSTEIGESSEGQLTQDMLHQNIEELVLSWYNSNIYDDSDYDRLFFISDVNNNFYYDNVVSEVNPNHKNVLFIHFSPFAYDYISNTFYHPCRLQGLNVPNNNKYQGDKNIYNTFCNGKDMKLVLIPLPMKGKNDCGGTTIDFELALNYLYNIFTITHTGLHTEQEADDIVNMLSNKYPTLFDDNFKTLFKNGLTTHYPINNIIHPDDIYYMLGNLIEDKNDIPFDIQEFTNKMSEFINKGEEYNDDDDDDNYIEKPPKTTIIKEIIPVKEVVKGVIKTEVGPRLNKSWTLSFSMRTKSWISFHDYQPNFYIHTPNSFYSLTSHRLSNVFKHNYKNTRLYFYSTPKPFIIEYVSVSNPLTTRIWNSMSFIVDVENIWGFDLNNTFFKKVMFYNSRQCSGILDVVVKDASHLNQDYLSNQVSQINNNTSIIVDRSERNWSINDFKDIRTNYNASIFRQVFNHLANTYIDKELDTSILNIHKEWTEQEPFRDKYLIVRLIEDRGYAGAKFSFHLSMDNESISSR